jgi:hypothetical protein
MGLYSLKGFPATRKLAEPLNTSAFIDTNPTDEPITSEVPVVRPVNNFARTALKTSY